MKEMKIQDHGALRKEMKAVASGKRQAPAHANGISFDSVETLLRLLIPQEPAVDR